MKTVPSAIINSEVNLTNGVASTKANTDALDDSQHHTALHAICPDNGLFGPSFSQN